MKYIKLFENFKPFKGTIIYHGTEKVHDIKDGHFFSVAEEFVLDYGHIIYKMELLTDNIFDSSIPDTICLAINSFWELLGEILYLNALYIFQL